MEKRKHRSFLATIILHNCLYVFALVFLFLVIYLEMQISDTRKSHQNILEAFAEKSGSQIEDLVGDMEKMSYNIAASDTVLSALKNAGNYTGSNNYFDLAPSERRDLLNLVQIFAGPNIGKKNIAIISSLGDSMALGNYETISYSREEMQNLSRMETFQTPTVSKYLVSPGEDLYGRISIPVFSFVRIIADEFGQYGYVEIQDSAATLDSILCDSLDSLHISTVITYNGDFFYASDSEVSDWASLNAILPESGQDQESIKISIDGKPYLLYTIDLKKYDLVIYSLSSMADIYKKSFQQAFFIILLGILLMILVGCISIVINNRLYAPVKELREKMEALPPDQLQIDLSDHTENDEIELFHHAFQKMLDSIRKQNDELLNRRLRELQLSYQALQTQVSPHFLYNTLSVIGLKGELGGNPEIMDMCSYLTKMMSYSLDTSTSIVPFSQEIEYMQYYLQLMKYRYLDKLEYRTQIDESLTSLEVPKFILQPIVENCFTHGFKNSLKETFLLSVYIEKAPDGWLIRVEDNGTGFSEEDKNRVYQEAAYVRDCVENPNADFVNHIHGIGLVNTYARLLLGLSGNVTLHIGESAMQGGLVEIHYEESVAIVGGEEH
ncbi:MAG: histidine kinase [Eubacteriales bacterium]|nr:histidine kinase [Eubacteriales bacterium]